MSIEGEAKEHMRGRWEVSSFTLTVADNGYILEYDTFYESDEYNTHETKKVYTNVDHALDTIRNICHTGYSSL